MCKGEESPIEQKLPLEILNKFNGKTREVGEDKFVSFENLKIFFSFEDLIRQLVRYIQHFASLVNISLS